MPLTGKPLHSSPLSSCPAHASLTDSHPRCNVHAARPLQEAHRARLAATVPPAVHGADPDVPLSAYAWPPGLSNAVKRRRASSLSVVSFEDSVSNVGSVAPAVCPPSVRVPGTVRPSALRAGPPEGPISPSADRDLPYLASFQVKIAVVGRNCPKLGMS